MGPVNNIQHLCQWLLHKFSPIKQRARGKKRVKQRERGIRTKAGIQHLSVSVILSTKLREKQREKEAGA